uniref:FAR-17a/AIG1-like protein n=1 Tax=Caenorhabditis tropicalis TaxID=1561998 RepID=A0A1I7UFY9_9PELO
MELFKHYGYTAFIATIIVSIMIALLIHGKPSHLCLIIEEWMNNIITFEKFFKVLVIQIVIACASLFLVTKLSAALKSDKEEVLIFNDCLLPDFSNSWNIFPVLACEFVGGFLFRFLLPKIDNKLHPKRIYLLPFLYAVFFASSLFLYGSSGHDFYIAFIRMPNCINTTEDLGLIFVVVIIYSIPSLIGWRCHSHIEPLPATFRSPWSSIEDKDRFAEMRAKEAARVVTAKAAKKRR